MTARYNFYIFNDKNQLLIVRNENTWTVPGGHPEMGENPLETLNREYRKEKIAEIYEIYQRKLKENNAIDFDDIINYTIKILMENPDVLEYYSNKFGTILTFHAKETVECIKKHLILALALKNKCLNILNELTPKDNDKVEDKRENL